MVPFQHLYENFPFDQRSRRILLYERWCLVVLLALFCPKNLMHKGRPGKFIPKDMNILESVGAMAWKRLVKFFFEIKVVRTAAPSPPLNQPVVVPHYNSLYFFSWRGAASDDKHHKFLNVCTYPFQIRHLFS